MVEDVKGLKTDVESEALVDGEGSRDCGIHIVIGRVMEGIAAKVSEGTGSVGSECASVLCGKVLE